MTTTAHHWIATRPGGLDVFEFVEVELNDPQSGEVTIDVSAAGVNPADAKHVATGDFTDPKPVGYELAGVVRALGPDTELASGGGAVGDEVLAFRISGGYATRVTVPAKDVFAKPAGLEPAAAANLLLAGSTASEMLHVTHAADGETIVVHGASGAVGVSVLQQARLAGVRVIATASPSSFDVVRQFGGEPVGYEVSDLEAQLRAIAPDGYAAALDCVGTDQAIDVSLALVPDRDRIVTIAAPQRGRDEGIHVIAGALPDSARYRDEVRPHLIALAADGRLVVPVARTYPLAEAVDALSFLQGGHPGGKLALIP